MFKEKGFFVDRKDFEVSVQGGDSQISTPFDDIKKCYAETSIIFHDIRDIMVKHHINLAKLGLQYDCHRKSSVGVKISIIPGFTKENITNVKNPHLFLDHDGKVWVHRIFILGMICLKDKRWKFSEISAGVTVPINEIKKCQESSWTNQINTVIDCIPDKDHSAHWYNVFYGRTKEDILKETISACLGIHAK